MKITDLFSDTIRLLEGGASLPDILRQSPQFAPHLERVQILEVDLAAVETWMRSASYQVRIPEFLEFVQEAPQIAEKVETLLQAELKGEIVIGPSLTKIDGFARYDSGAHRVLIGPDYPRADTTYRKVLLAHELSHVFREGTLLDGMSREEYLNGFTLKEHLVSEGLAVLFSEVVYGEVAPAYFTFHTPEELKWCQDHFRLIGEAVQKCSSSSKDEVWMLYNAHAITPGSAPWAHYYWASCQIRTWFQEQGIQLNQAILEAHKWPTERFQCFMRI